MSSPQHASRESTIRASVRSLARRRSGCSSQAHPSSRRPTRRSVRRAAARVPPARRYRADRRRRTCRSARRDATPFPATAYSAPMQRRVQRAVRAGEIRRRRPPGPGACRPGSRTTSSSGSRTRAARTGSESLIRWPTKTAVAGRWPVDPVRRLRKRRSTAVRRRRARRWRRRSRRSGSTPSAKTAIVAASGDRGSRRTRSAAPAAPADAAAGDEDEHRLDRLRRPLRDPVREGRDREAVRLVVRVRRSAYGVVATR